MKVSGARKHRLIETEWPDFGPEPLAAPLVPPEEFAARLDQLRGRMNERRLTHLLVYGDREHFANLAWCTNFDPRFEEAVLILRSDGSHPLLVVGNECESYLPISPLWQRGTLRAERYQPFSLLDQPRDASRTLQEIFGAEGIGAGARVGCAGWKYYGHPHRMDTPSYIVDTVRELAGADQTVDATDLFVHPGYGVRSTCSAAEIAFFEYTNVKASNAMRRVHFALRPGITDHQLLAEARYDGLPLSCHITCKTGPRRVSLASASGNRVERGHTWSANVAYWGSNICRAGWVVERPSALPEPARDYVSAFAGPYFAAMGEWLGGLRPGVPGASLYDAIHARLPFERFGIFLNPGHLIHLDEWVSSPIYAGSPLPIRSGMVLQTDVIPSSPTYFSTRMEDGVAVADDALQQTIREHYPETWARCQARRRFVETTLGIQCPQAVLLLSNMACLVPPYLLRPNTVLALER
jgi:Xaa-Pro aminopeptidase